MIATGLSRKLQLKPWCFAYTEQQYKVLGLIHYPAYNGTNVSVVRPLTAEEADGPEHGEEQMYEVRAEDGELLQVFESEILP